MTARTLVTGKRKTVGTILTTTNATEILTAVAGFEYSVFGISVANIDPSNACTLKLEFNDGSTDYTLVQELSLSAKQSDVPVATTDFPLFLNGTGSIKATAQNANDLHMVVSYVETPGRNY
jgi:hypothetical protein